MPHQQCYNCKTAYEIGRKHCRKCGSVLLLHDRYIIRRVLGRGGFAIVYEALDIRINNRRVAIKKVSTLSPHEQQAIVTEVEILAGNASRFGFIPSIYDILREKEHTYIVMEYISGPTLSAIPRPWQPHHVEYFLHLTLNNLEQLHAARIIHRDLKPDNIKYTPSGRAPYTILDFGISKLGKGRALKALSPDFSAPEQTSGLEGDSRSDIFSLGATAYYLLTNMYLTQAIGKGRGNIPAPSTLGIKVSPALDTTLLRMLALDPNQRPSSAAATRVMLGSLTSHPTPTHYLPPMPPRAEVSSHDRKNSYVSKTPPRGRSVGSFPPILLISGGGIVLTLLLVFVVLAVATNSSGGGDSLSPTVRPTQTTLVSNAAPVSDQLTEADHQDTVIPSTVLATSTPILSTSPPTEPVPSIQQESPIPIPTLPIPTSNPEPSAAPQETPLPIIPTILTIPPTLPPPTALPIPQLVLVSIPNVVGLLAGDAYSILGASDLIGTDFEQSVPGCAPFVVVSQDPPAGAQVPPRSVVSFGICPQGPLTPAVVGLQIEEARAILTAIGFQVVEITYGDRRYRNGYVGDQIPSPGQPAPDGVVTLSVVRNVSGGGGNDSGVNAYP